MQSVKSSDNQHWPLDKVSIPIKYVTPPMSNTC